MPKELSNGVSTWGAQMGRRNTVTEPNYPVKFRLEKLRFYDGAYDKGGAYWGCGNPIFHAWGDGEEFEQEMFVRAKDRDDAKNQILTQFKQAKFYR